MKTNPILLEILYNNLLSIAQQMGYTLQRTGHTIYVKETADFAGGLFTLNGELVALSLPVGVGSRLCLNAKDVIDYFDEYKEGDIIVTNDPYATGGFSTHLPDINLFKPLFYKSELVAFAWAFVHSSDVGGAVAGSISPSNYEIYQEGLRILPIKLYKAGQLNREFLEHFMANCRIPEGNWGDIKAMISALNTGERRFYRLVDKYGLETIKQAMEDLLEYGHQRTEAIIKDIPDGTYQFWDYLDDDFVSDVPVRICLKMTVKDGRLHLDFEGTDPQVKSALNWPIMGKVHPQLTFTLQQYLFSADHSLPMNGGFARALSLNVAKGSILNPEFPAACGVRAATVLRVSNVILGALAQAVPGKVPAAPAGIITVVVLSEPKLDGIGRNVLVLEPLHGGTGGAPEMDGVDGLDIGPANQSNNPIESLGVECSAIIREYGIRADSGGAGQYRGGNGIVLEFQVTRPDTIVTARGMERYKFRPWGVRGGRCGQPGKTVLNPGTPQERDLGKIDVLKLDPGDVVRIMTAGGGGYGNPLERDPRKVLYDVRQGFVSRQAAKKEYGVVIEDGQVNYEETRRARLILSKERAIRDFDFGPEREEYEKRWTPEVRSSLVRLIYELPVDFRDYAKNKLFADLDRLTREKRATESDLYEHWEALKSKLGVL
jgi:N-methylhydantoinase B